jgi:ribose transport system substrate-binding protein
MNDHQMGGFARLSRIAAATAVVAIAAVIAAACGSSDSSSSSSATSSGGGTAKAANVAWLTYSNDGLYIPQEVAGTEGVISPNGGSVTLFDAKLDQQEQLKQCEDALTSQRFNAIVLQPVNNAAAAVCVTQARAAGIPVVALEFPVGDNPNTLDIQVPGVVGTVAGTVQGQAEKAYQGLQDACKGMTQCNVALEVAARADPLGAAIIDQVKKNGAADGIKLVAITEGAYDIAQTAKTLPDVIAANPDLNVFMAEADTNALAAIPVIKDAGKENQIKVMGLGGSTSMIDAIKAGTVYGTVAYWPLTAGKVVGQMVQDAVDGKAIANTGVDFQTVAPDQPLIVTKENVDKFTPEWGEQ